LRVIICSYYRTERFENDKTERAIPNDAVDQKQGDF